MCGAGGAIFIRMSLDIHLAGSDRRRREGLARPLALHLVFRPSADGRRYYVLLPSHAAEAAVDPDTER
jgi:hypothetical protein